VLTFRVLLLTRALWWVKLLFKFLLFTPISPISPFSALLPHLPDPCSPECLTAPCSFVKVLVNMALGAASLHIWLICPQWVRGRWGCNQIEAKMGLLTCIKMLMFCSTKEEEVEVRPGERSLLSMVSVNNRSESIPRIIWNSLGGWHSTKNGTMRLIFLQALHNTGPVNEWVKTWLICDQNSHLFVFTL